MKLKTTEIYDFMERSYEKGVPIIVQQGGSRSGKTYNILIWLILHCVTDWDNKIIDIGRKTFPSLRFSVMHDFFEILKKYNLYHVNLHDKSNHSYKLGSNTIRFFSVDQEQKVRGSRRDILFMNEANEFRVDDFKQLNQRTAELTILDYNPSDEFHWIYDDVLTRKDVDFYKTTFRDNPFLEKRIRQEIYSYKDKDPNYWRIYGLGERGVSESTIYTHWDTLPKYEGEGREFYGMDFGFNDPTTLVRTKYHEFAGIVTEELLYKTNLTSDQIVFELEQLERKKLLTKTSTIIADSARPEIIAEIKKAGYNIHPAKKIKGSVLRDINFIKRSKFRITEGSVNMLREVKTYKWKVDKNDRVLDEPVDIHDHCLDAVRYSISPFSGRKRRASAVIVGSHM